MHLPALAHAYLCGALDALVRERVMVAVSRANACAGCAAVHELWALGAGISTAELDAVGLGDVARPTTAVGPRSYTPRIGPKRASTAARTTSSPR